MCGGGRRCRSIKLPVAGGREFNRAVCPRALGLTGAALSGASAGALAGASRAVTGTKEVVYACAGGGSPRFGARLARLAGKACQQLAPWVMCGGDRRCRSIKLAVAGGSVESLASATSPAVPLGPQPPTRRAPLQRRSDQPSPCRLISRWSTWPGNTFPNLRPSRSMSKTGCRAQREARLARRRHRQRQRRGSSRAVPDAAISRRAMTTC